MGGQCTKMRVGDALQPSTKIKGLAALTSYKAACANDPELQSFDRELHRRTSRVIDTFAIRSLSIDSLKEYINFLQATNQDAVPVILECREDIWKNQELFSLVKQYLEISIKTMDFCAALSDCLKRARNSQTVIQIAVKQFEEEARMQDGVSVKNYVKTLKALQEFKEAGDPFTEEFFQSFESLRQQQSSMLEKLMARKEKLDKKLNSVKVWRRVSNVVFVAAFVSALIFSVVAAAIAAPPIVPAIAGAVSAPIGTVGKWIDSLWNSYEKELKGEKAFISPIQFDPSLIDIYSIRASVDELEIKLKSVQQNAEFALGEEDALKFVIDEIKKKLEELQQNIDTLGERADKCSRYIKQARTMIMQRIDQIS